ncbi:MAG TPA: alternative ribosome rescue aminoacyl-tRNA hydrolase ArfB [Bacteroidales bacterium]|nr:alternative ribosome rescue aminoacyl-tRNA hydrolase ArfB [Bacteroidales bacterium]
MKNKRSLLKFERRSFVFYLYSMIRDIDFTPEINFSFSRSSGKGGQNVNKVATRVELRFNIPSSTLLTDEQKSILMNKLENRINKEGDLLLFAEETRSQLKNKELVIARFYDLLEENLKVKKKRKPTKPGKKAKEKKLKEKKIVGEKKERRKKINPDDR